MDEYLELFFSYDSFLVLRIQTEWKIISRERDIKVRLSNWMGPSCANFTLIGTSGGGEQFGLCCTFTTAFFGLASTKLDERKRVRKKRCIHRDALSAERSQTDPRQAARELFKKIFSLCRLNFQRSRRWRAAEICAPFAFVFVICGWRARATLSRRFFLLERKGRKGNSGYVKAKGKSGSTKETTGKNAREKSRASRGIHDVATVRRFAPGCT